MTQQRPSDGDRFATVRAGRLRRTAPVVGFAARAAGSRVVAGLRSRTGDSEAIDRYHRNTADRYAEMLGHSKGALMKVGQLLSTFEAPPDSKVMSTYQAAMQRLQSDAPPMDAATTREIIAGEFGRPVDELFSRFADRPIASASIGQVHEGWLPDGRHVAVKIQYPGVAQAIRDDLANSELLVTFLRMGMSLTPRAMRTDLREVAAEVSARVLEEVDYRHEAANIALFAALWRDHPFVRVPDIVDELSGDRVLTMTFLDGIGWQAAQQADADLRNRWGESIAYFSFGGYRHSDVFNADPHPGNYRFADDGTVGFVDFGCVKRFPEAVRLGIVTMTRTTDRELLYRQMLDAGFVDGAPDLTPDDVYEWWSTMTVNLGPDQPHTFRPEDSTYLVRSMVDDDTVGSTAMRRMTIPSDWAMLARINLGVDAILATLGTTLDTREMVDALDGVGEARSARARAHVAWVRERGLPSGLDDRQH